MPLFSFRMSCDDCGRVGKCKAGKISVLFELLLNALLHHQDPVGAASLSCPNCRSSKLQKVDESVPDRDGTPPAYTIE